MRKGYSIFLVAIIAIALVLTYSITCVDRIVNAEPKEEIEEKISERINALSKEFLKKKV